MKTNKTDNVIIAEFMGDRDKILCDPKWQSGDELVYLRYHLSWDWIMPVVEKISEFGVWTIRPGFACFENYKGELREHRKFTFMKSTGDFEEVDGESVSWCFLVACVCIEFIKWCNSNPPTK